jgi:hypothetical protein
LPCEKLAPAVAAQIKRSELPLTSRSAVPCCPLLSSAVLGIPESRGCQDGPRRLWLLPSDYAAFPILSRTCVRYAGAVGTWHDLNVGRPITAPLERCAELLGVDLATIREAAANVEPYLRTDDTRIWSLMQLERQLRPGSTGGVAAATSTADGPQRPTNRNRTSPTYGTIVEHGRPHPYQLNAGNRCADRHSCRSRPTVGAQGMRSISPLVCVLPMGLETR